MAIRHNCSTCAHLGSCDHYCGGSYWEPEDDDRDDDDGDVRDDYDPWDGYDEQDAMDQWCADHPRDDP